MTEQSEVILAKARIKKDSRSPIAVGDKLRGNDNRNL